MRGTSRRLLLVLGLASLLFAPAARAGELSVATSTDVLSNEQIVHNFGVIALGDEFRQSKDPRIIKWTGPLRVFARLDTTVTPANMDFLARHLARLATIIGMPIDRVKTEKDANFLIIFTDDAKFPALAMEHLRPASHDLTLAVQRALPRTNCLAYFQSDRRSYNIRQATVLIPVDRAIGRGVLDLCMVEETTQALGLPNDSDDVNPSIFNDISPLKNLSEQDVLMLRMLYDRRMDAGMKPKEALSTAQQILSEIRRVKELPAPGPKLTALRPLSRPQ